MRALEEESSVNRWVMHIVVKVEGEGINKGGMQVMEEQS